ncbi:hypothetical protein FRC02_010333 [Tulasnella sp. 418]|nr:hypothetical protein FRC02_010333 [Tulasnella sp. 418]
MPQASMSHWWLGSTPRLPFELRIRIIEEVGTPAVRYPQTFDLPRYCFRTLLNLSLVSKAFHQWTEPLLYRHISVGLVNIVGLYNTLYEKAHRPPFPPLSRSVESLRIVKPAWDTLPADYDRKDLNDHLEYVLSHVMGNLKRLYLGVPLSSRMRDIIEAMPNLQTLALTSGTMRRTFLALNPYPVLPKSVQNYLLHVEAPESITDIIGAVAGSNIQTIVFPFPSFSRASIVELIRGLIRHCGMLESIMIIPDSLEWTSQDGTNTPPPVAKLAMDIRRLEYHPEIRQLMEKDSIPSITIVSFPHHLRVARHEDRETWIAQMIAVGGIWNTYDETYWFDAWLTHRIIELTINGK